LSPHADHRLHGRELLRGRQRFIQTDDAGLGLTKIDARVQGDAGGAAWPVRMSGVAFLPMHPIQVAAKLAELLLNRAHPGTEGNFQVWRKCVPSWFVHHPGLRQRRAGLKSSNRHFRVVAEQAVRLQPVSSLCETCLRPGHDAS